MSFGEPCIVTIRRLSTVLLLPVILFLLTGNAIAQKNDDLATKIESALTIPAFKNASLGLRICSLDDGRVLYERNPDMALTPASNLKLLTASTAAARLGPAFRFVTRLYRSGEVMKSGELKGDLYLKGSGDPSLTSSHLASMVEELKKLGVRTFKGRILADPSVFDDKTLGLGWEWDDETFYYCAQVSGLNCDENVVNFEVKPGAKAGDPVTITLGEKTRYLTVRNLAKTGAPGGPASIDFERTRARNEVVIAGTLPTDAKPVSEPITMEDPALFAATRFYEAMEKAGIALPKVEARVAGKSTTPTTAILTATHESEPLPKILSDFLKPSDNLYGECLLKTLGAQKNGVGTWEGGAKVVRDFLTELGIDTDGLVMADGSGLTRRNTVTPRLLTDLLTAVDKKLPAEAKEMFIDGLPVSGVDGTLRNRYKGTNGQGVVRAKTGSLTGVSSLSGYVTTLAGEHLVFSIIMNQFHSRTTATQVRAVQDAIVLALIERPKP